MKLTKEDNPFGVQVRQKWRPKDGRREFVISQIEKCLNGIFAVADYGGAHRMINLLGFDRYTRVK